MPVAFYTIGHSTHGIEEFVGLLRSIGVQFLVDVRTIPRSGEIPSSIEMSFRQRWRIFRSGISTWRLSAAFDPSATSRPQ